MSALAELLADGAIVANHRPWPRAVVDHRTWRAACDRLSQESVSLLGLWGDTDMVHLTLLDGGMNSIAVLTLNCPEQSFPSVGAHHPPALRLERALHDLFGLRPEGIPDARPWLDHGSWGLRHPLGKAPSIPGESRAYVFLPSDGEGLHQIPVGPVHAGTIEPGHFRFTANGETVVRLEERLGYVHKGIEHLMRGAGIAHAAKLAGRTSGDSTVAYAYAFARAVEAALGVESPLRAVWLRALMAEIERLANHLGDIGAICNDAAFALMHAQCAVLRERVLRTADECFGHRLMRDRIVPGGVAVDLNGDGGMKLAALVRELRKAFAPLVELYDSVASLQDRTVGTGVLAPKLAAQYACGGFVGRASGRRFDTRRMVAYPPYDSLVFDVPAFQQGDVNARVWVRVREVEQSLALIDQILERLPSGPVHVDINPTGASREGGALVEGFRGDILIWLRIDAGGAIERCHLRDPSWFQWPLLEAVIEDNIVADFPLCNKSFNCSYSGHDL